MGNVGTDICVPTASPAASTNVVFYDDGSSRCLAVKLTNRTGAPTVKGYLVSASPSYDMAFRYTQTNTPDPFGVALEADIADGAECLIAKVGIAQVYFAGNVTRGTFARANITADGAAHGVAINEALPSPPFATDKHFQEIGHPVESRTGAGLARCSIHFL